ncbi:MAG TPA: sulfotransferase [Acidimicrobiales bacterium]|nr:sulfotransferase [Acidimicrobiales bacterium]
MTEHGERDQLSVPVLLEEAAARSGLDDWGDLSFTATLQLLIDSCRETADLNPTGWSVLRRAVLRHLRNRLYMQAYATADGDGVAWGRAAISAPVVITGLPRTGTTLLHNLLALDACHRVLRFWEALHPVPPDPSRGTSEEALVTAAERWLERLYALTPGFRAIHGATARGPEECDALMQNSFASQHFDDMFRATAYSVWLNAADLVDEYGYYAFQLGVLTRPEDRERRWVLKSPSHLGYLATLRATFPDAVVVHCHRDPCQAVGSYASLVLAVRSPHSDTVAPADVGRHALERSARAMDRALRARDAAGGAGFVDMAYAELVADPLGAVRRLYARLGDELHADTEAAMTAWLGDNPQHKHGRHRYTLEQFGLSAAEVSGRFAGYADRFSSHLAVDVPRTY